MPKYQLWYSKEDNSLDFFEKSDERNMRLLPDDARMLWEVESESWEEAQAKKHEFMGWEPYKPMKEDNID